jgi:uncharacterized protein YndB with AHSA1/START domain
MSTARPTGLTRDAGWQIGVSRTLPVDVDTAWRVLLSPAGLAVWLGDGVREPLRTGAAYETADGTTGEVRSLHPGDRIRLTWQPPGRGADATVQLTVRPAARGCTVRFHAERLHSEAERTALRAHWRAVLERLAALLAAR